MLKAMDKDNKSPSVFAQLQRQCSGFNTLRRVSLTLHGEKRTIGKVFRMPKTGTGDLESGGGGVEGIGVQVVPTKHMSRWRPVLAETA